MLFFASAAGRSPHGEAGGNRLPGADIRPFLHRLNSGRVRSGSAITGKAQRGRTGQKACKESFHHVDFPFFLNLDCLIDILSIEQLYSALYLISAKVW